MCIYIYIYMYVYTYIYIYSLDVKKSYFEGVTSESWTLISASSSWRSYPINFNYRFILRYLLLILLLRMKYHAKRWEWLMKFHHSSALVLQNFRNITDTSIDSLFQISIDPSTYPISLSCFRLSPGQQITSNHELPHQHTESVWSEGQR